MTVFNVVVIVLSMFIMLLKSIMFVLHTWIPLLSAAVHAALVALFRGGYSQPVSIGYERSG